MIQIKKLMPDKLGVSEWSIVKDESIMKWLVVRTYDTIDQDCETGEPCYGASFDVYGEYDTKAEAEIRVTEANAFLHGKAGYIIIA
jgi:hypothetical protein